MQSPATPLPDPHQADHLIRLFNDCFMLSHRTVLIRGSHEPIYLPADADCPHHRVVFAHGFFASALHEIAHWCVAGERRRALMDYGYWYCPDGRTAEQQRVFEGVEVKPQALEWIFAKAAGFPFRISVDNLSGEVTDPTPFKCAVHAQVRRYCQSSLNARARRFREALANFYGTPELLWDEQFSLAELR